jgi:small membrane protein
MPIKVILILGLCALAVLCLLIIRNRLATRLFFIAQLMVGAVLVLFPELANYAASLVGVGRGADLLLYLLVLAVYAGGLLAMAKFRRLERQMTELVRQVALREASDPPKSALEQKEAGDVKP